MFWNRKKAVADTEPKQSEPPIIFSPNDDSLTRARNIWFALGFANDRFGGVNRIAGYLEMYRELDKGETPALRPDLYDLATPNTRGDGV